MKTNWPFSIRLTVIGIIMQMAIGICQPVFAYENLLQSYSNASKVLMLTTIKSRITLAIRG